MASRDSSVRNRRDALAMTSAEKAVGYRIRESKRDDCPSIMALIRELAEYERMSERVVITSATLERDAFDTEPPCFFCLVAEAPSPKESDGGGGDTGNGSTTAAVVGYAMYYYSYSPFVGRTVQLEDIYVHPSHRKLGVGLALVRRVAAAGRERGCAAMHWIVLNDNELAVSFYDRLGAKDVTRTENWHLYALGRAEMDGLAAPQSVVD